MIYRSEDQCLQFVLFVIFHRGNFKGTLGEEGGGREIVAIEPDGAQADIHQLMFHTAWVPGSIPAQLCTLPSTSPETILLVDQKEPPLAIVRRRRLTRERDMSCAPTASPKPSFGRHWKVVDAVVGGGKAGWTT